MSPKCLPCRRFYFLQSAMIVFFLTAPHGWWVCSMALPSEHCHADRTTLLENARQIRTRLGHEAALPLYQSLLEPKDMTAASRLAAAPDTPQRHDAACRVLEQAKILQLRQLLLESNCNHAHIDKLFRVKSTTNSVFVTIHGPLYLKPPVAGSILPILLQDKQPPSCLECLVSLFLLGMAVPLNVLVKSLVGGQESFHLLEELGLVFPCQVDSSLVVPYVHLFPLVISLKHAETLFLVTDLHPRVLSTTTVGTQNHGTVMYIGPDSLALVQHQLVLQQSLLRQNNMQEPPTRILDLCTGSGIQALATILALRSILAHIQATAVCVDCNPRALQFTKFNAILNQMDDNVQVIQADLIGSSDKSQSVTKWLHPIQTANQHYDVVLANPPFIPVPPNVSERYGLFSSGGLDGEVVLQAVLELSTQVLTPHHGWLAVVSEFMNPGNVLHRMGNGFRTHQVVVSGFQMNFQSRPKPMPLDVPTRLASCMFGKTTYPNGISHTCLRDCCLFARMMPQTAMGHCIIDSYPKPNMVPSGLHPIMTQLPLSKRHGMN